MDNAALYSSIKERERLLDTRRQVLEAEEARKKAERDKIDQFLIKAGIDPTKADEELVRLETEEATRLKKANDELDAYEKALNNLGVAQVDETLEV